MAKYEIWIGNYHLGQGYDPPTEPELVGKVVAPSFKVACWVYELESTLQHVRQRIDQGQNIEDIHFGKLYYDPKTNSNSWTGKYYQTKEEALKSF